MTTYMVCRVALGEDSGVSYRMRVVEAHSAYEAKGFYAEVLRKLFPEPEYYAWDVAALKIAEGLEQNSLIDKLKTKQLVANDTAEKAISAGDSVSAALARGYSRAITEVLELLADF